MGKEKSKRNLKKIVKKTAAKKKTVAQSVSSIELPKYYGISSVTLIARDPHWVYSYWEIAASDIEIMKKKYGTKAKQATVILRVYDVTCRDFNGKNANHWFDIDVGYDAKNWYINLWNDNATYCAEIGWRFSDEEFFALKRSNFVTTQRAHTAVQNDVAWMEVNENQQQPSSIISAPNHQSQNTYSMSSAFGQSVFSPKGKKTKYKNAGILQKPSTKRKPLSSEEIKAYYLKLSPLLRKARKSEQPIVGTDYEITLELESILSDDFQIDNIKQRNVPKVKHIGSSKVWDFEVQSEESKVEDFIGASEGFQSTTDDKKDFYFEIGTELIVYGRTEPGAKVTCSGEPVALRDDGTFTMRCALPDEGNIPLDFIAQSIQKNLQRSISTKVVRNKTTYSQ